MSNKDVSILIVDDTKFSSAIVGRNLKAAGYTDIRHAASAQEALKKLEERPAALTLADWLMPEMDGLELTRRIRQQDEHLNRFTYIILLTAKEGVPALQQAFDEGVDDFISKSTINEQLLSRVMAGERMTSTLNNVLAQNRELLYANAKLKQHSVLDPQTGFGNPQYAVRKLNDAIRQAQLRGGAACLLVLRIEDLYDLEQHHGTETINELIQAMSRRLRQLVRPMDTLARLTSNTFAMITYQENPGHCVPTSFRRLHEGLNLRAYKTSTAGYVQSSVSVSMCAAHEQHDMEGQEIIQITLQGLDESRAGKFISLQQLPSHPN